MRGFDDDDEKKKVGRVVVGGGGEWWKSRWEESSFHWNGKRKSNLNLWDLQLNYLFSVTLKEQFSCHFMLIHFISFNIMLFFFSSPEWKS